MPNEDAKDFRVVFVGRRNAFDLALINWLNERFTVPAAFFIEEDRFTLKARWEKIKGRARMYGWRRAIDELLFHVYYRVGYSRKEARLWATRMPAPFAETRSTAVESYSVDDIHSEEWLAKVRETQPDILISVCTHTIFKKRLYTIPRYGMFVMHEGLTPEYRGLHTIAWALLQDEPQYVGYTLFKVNRGIDSGAILCQGLFPDAKRYGFSWGFIGHRGLLYGLEHMGDALRRLYLHDGQFEPVPQTGRRDGNYTWMPLSSFIRGRMRRRREGRSVPRAAT
jgi:hypothetical protein